MTTQTCGEVPAEWRLVRAEALDRAESAGLQALATDSVRPAHRRLANFYDRSRDFAGASFVNLAPADPNDIAAVDLHATTLLSVGIGPSATRRLLEPSSTRARLLVALAAVPVKDLRVATAVDLRAMETLYGEVKAMLSNPGTANPNAWVTASKLCARKRPGLFPVRDNVVCEYLGLIPASGRGDYQIDWQVFRALIGSRAVIDAIDALMPLMKVEVEGKRVEADTGRLRLLDAALWTWASGKG